MDKEFKSKLDERVEEFEKENPNIRVTYYDANEKVLVDRGWSAALGISCFVIGFIIGSLIN